VSKMTQKCLWIARFGPMNDEGPCSDSWLDATVTQRILGNADIDCPSLIITAIRIQRLERHTSQPKEFLGRGFAAHVGPDLDRRRDHNRCQMLLWDMSIIYGRSLSKPSPESLLDTYQAERRPVAARVLPSRFSGRMPAQRLWETPLLNFSCPMNSQAIAAEVSGLSVH